MIYTYKESKIKGAYELFPNVFEDHRGKLVKPFYKESFLDLGLDCDFGEAFITTNFKHVIRGFHFQKPPYCQARLLYCITGSFFNVLIDIRKNSPTYGQYDTFEISSVKNSALYVPEGIANAYCTLEEPTVIEYHLTKKYMPEYEMGLRYNCIQEILWPAANPIISEKDLRLPLFNDFESPFE